MIRTTLRMVLAVLLLQAMVWTSPTFAAAAYEIQSILVKCTGFASYEVQSFLSQGARLIVDKSFASYEVSSFVSQGKDRVSIVADGFAGYELSSWAQQGATIIDAGGGSPGSGGSFYDQMRILQSGGRVAVDHRLASYEVTQLISVGKDRVTVVCKGFASYEVSSFLSSGASVWVDHSFATYEVSSFCSIGHARVTVVADGFAQYELQGFAAQGAAIQYDAAPSSRELKFSALYGAK
ncbi:MAG: hypothetical protein HY303_09135 [Candidatus Wallbacteria bacterium]|nr:hypothetical protein [Candidatus Wallbacteria bacterium]